MMDAVEFLEQLKKRSKSNPDYYGEELNIAHIEPISLVSQVEQWPQSTPSKPARAYSLSSGRTRVFIKRMGYRWPALATSTTS